MKSRYHMDAVQDLSGLGHRCGDSQGVIVFAMSRMTSKISVLSPLAPLSSSQSLPVSPLSFAFRDGAGALVVEVDHDADAALVAPFGGVVCTHTHDSGIVCCIPCLRCRLPKQSLYARGLSRAEVYDHNAHAKEYHPLSAGPQRAP